MSDDPAPDPTLTPSGVGLLPTSAASLAPAPGAAAGALPGRYTPGRRIGAGGMGEVVLARDEQLGRDVAIKRMRVVPSDEATSRFIREAKIQGMLDHPAVVPVHELSTDSEGRPFFVMKRLAGTTLAEILAGHAPRPLQKLLRAFADVCLAVEFAHRHGIVHRDLKPANIMIGDFGEVYVLDWGIARVLAEPDDLGGAPLAPELGGDMTQAGAILGTPGYIAPELLRGEPIAGRADVFALGAILFEILAGEPLVPRDRALDADAIDGRVSHRVPEREVAPELEAACLAATARDPGERPSARELADMIERYIDGDRDLALRRTLAGAHLEAARAALAGGDTVANRATAMREAGRAIALDPRNADATRLVGTLVLEAPRETPPEVEVRLDAINQAALRSKARTATWATVVLVLMIPVMLAVGVHDFTLLAVFSAALGGAVGVTAWVAFGTSPVTRTRQYLLALTNALMIAFLSRTFSPFLVAPGMAAIVVTLFALDPRLRWGWIASTFALALLTPWLLELVGVWSRTIRSIDGELVLRSSIVEVQLPHLELGLALFAVTLLSLGGLVAHRHSREHQIALRRVELQAWHLRQLVRE